MRDSDPVTNEGMKEALENLKKIIVEDGPFDGALGFSQGGAMVMALLFDHHNTQPLIQPLFQVAIIFNSGMPQVLQAIAPKEGFGSVPTAHIIGTKDYLYHESVQLMNACTKNSRFVYEHDEGHAIPRKPILTVGIANVVHRAIETARLKT